MREQRQVQSLTNVAVLFQLRQPVALIGRQRRQAALPVVALQEAVGGAAGQQPQRLFLPQPVGMFRQFLLQPMHGADADQRPQMAALGGGNRRWESRRQGLVDQRAVIRIDQPLRISRVTDAEQRRLEADLQPDLMRAERTVSLAKQIAEQQRHHQQADNHGQQAIQPEAPLRTPAARQAAAHAGASVQVRRPIHGAPDSGARYAAPAR